MNEQLNQQMERQKLYTPKHKCCGYNQQMTKKLEKIWQGDKELIISS